MKLPSRILVLLFFALISVLTSAQSHYDWVIKNERKGEFFAYWGWHRTQYSSSNIHLIGPDYDFTLQGVIAKDKVHPILIDYFHPQYVTLPQNNYGFGYFISDNWALSLNMDHMKYVVQNGQSVAINGNINTSVAGSYEGQYHGEQIELSPDFITYEHTDGLNYLNIAADWMPTIWISKNGNQQVSLIANSGLGLLIPKTNVTLFNTWHRDEFALSGWGINAGAGVRFFVYKRFYIQALVKGGFIHLWNVNTLGDGHRAQQHFTFLTEIGTFGFSFRLTKNKTNAETTD